MHLLHNHKERRHYHHGQGLNNQIRCFSTLHISSTKNIQKNERQKTISLKGNSFLIVHCVLVSYNLVWATVPWLLFLFVWTWGLHLLLTNLFLCVLFLCQHKLPTDSLKLFFLRTFSKARRKFLIWKIFISIIHSGLSLATSCSPWSMN